MTPKKNCTQKTLVSVRYFLLPQVVLLQHVADPSQYGAFSVQYTEHQLTETILVPCHPWISLSQSLLTKKETGLQTRS